MSTQTKTKPNTEVDEWAAKLSRLRNRKPLERPLTFHDEDTASATDEGRVVAGRAEARARKEAQAALSIKDPTDPKVEAAVSADKTVIETRAKVTDLEAEQADAAVVLVVRGLGSDLYEEMQGEHPPTPAQAKRGEEYNVKTFAPALVAACVVGPMTVEFADELLTTILTNGEAAILFNTCVAVNQASRVTLGKG